MMDGTPDIPEGGDDEPRMTILAIQERYWLFEGEEFLDAMLLGQGYFPKPVRCVRFADAFELNIFLGPDQSVAKFWGINPDIVARLRRNEHLLEIEGPDG